MAFQRKGLICSKICIYVVVTEQVNSFKYFSYYNTHKNEKDITEKNSKLQQSNGSNKPSVQTQSSSETYKN
jgi:hypothetical protein